MSYDIEKIDHPFFKELKSEIPRPNKPFLSKPQLRVKTKLQPKASSSIQINTSVKTISLNEKQTDDAIEKIETREKRVLDDTLYTWGRLGNRGDIYILLEGIQMLWLFKCYKKFENNSTDEGEDLTSFYHIGLYAIYKHWSKVGDPYHDRRSKEIIDDYFLVNFNQDESGKFNAYIYFIDHYIPKQGIGDIIISRMHWTDPIHLDKLFVYLKTMRRDHIAANRYITFDTSHHRSHYEDYFDELPYMILFTFDFNFQYYVRGRPLIQYPITMDDDFYKKQEPIGNLLAGGQISDNEFLYKLNALDLRKKLMTIRGINPFYNFMRMSIHHIFGEISKKVYDPLNDPNYELVYYVEKENDKYALKGYCVFKMESLAFKMGKLTKYYQIGHICILALSPSIEDEEERRRAARILLNYVEVFLSTKQKVFAIYLYPYNLEFVIRRPISYSGKKRRETYKWVDDNIRGFLYRINPFFDIMDDPHISFIRKDVLKSLLNRIRLKKRQRFQNNEFVRGQTFTLSDGVVRSVELVHRIMDIFDGVILPVDASVPLESIDTTFGGKL